MGKILDRVNKELGGLAKFLWNLIRIVLAIGVIGFFYFYDKAINSDIQNNTTPIEQTSE